MTYSVGIACAPFWSALPVSNVVTGQQRPEIEVDQAVCCFVEAPAFRL